MGVSRLLPGLIHQPHTGADLAAGETAWDAHTHTHTETHTLYIQMYRKQLGTTNECDDIVRRVHILSVHRCVDLRLAVFDTERPLRGLCLAVPKASFSTPLCYFAAESFTPDSICRLAATVVPVHTARAKPRVGQHWCASSKFPSCSMHRNKRRILSDAVDGGTSQEARHFHLGAKWF